MIMLGHFEKLTTIVIPNYLREITLSKSQRPKYFEWDGTTIKSKGKKLWKKCINKQFEFDITMNDGNIKPNWLAVGYVLIGFKGAFIYSIQKPLTTYEQIFNLTDKQLKKPTKYIVCKEDEQGDIQLDKTYSKVIANPTQAGTANMQVISGQHFYSQVINEFTRNKIVSKLKESYYAKFTSIRPSLLIFVKKTLNNNYPLFICLEIQDTVKAWNDNTIQGDGRAWDVPNRALPYLKTFTDFLVNGYENIEKNQFLDKIIIDDDRLHLSGDMNIFTPIDETQIRKLKFHIYADKRNKL